MAGRQLPVRLQAAAGRAPEQQRCHGVAVSGLPRRDGNPTGIGDGDGRASQHGCAAREACSLFGRVFARLRKRFHTLTLALAAAHPRSAPSQPRSSELGLRLLGRQQDFRIIPPELGHVRKQREVRCAVPCDRRRRQEPLTVQQTKYIVTTVTQLLEYPGVFLRLVLLPLGKAVEIIF